MKVAAQNRRKCLYFNGSAIQKQESQRIARKPQIGQLARGSAGRSFGYRNVFVCKDRYGSPCSLERIIPPGNASIAIQRKSQVVFPGRQNAAGQACDGANVSVTLYYQPGQTGILFEGIRNCRDIFPSAELVASAFW